MVIAKPNQTKHNNKGTEPLTTLYGSVVRPNLEYAAPVWSPELIKDSVQKFALRICTKQWNLSYADL